MKRQFYICGSNGFIGSRLVSFLAKRHNDIEVIGYDPRRQDISSIDTDQHPNALFIYAAYDRRGVLRNILSIIDALRFCKRKGISRIIFLSSISIFSTRTQGYFELGASKASVWEDYILIKKIQEILLRLSCIFNIVANTCILRAPIVLGKDCSWQNTLYYIASYSHVALPNYGNGLFNYIYVDDLSRQIADCAMQPDDFGLKYIAPSNGCMSWKEVLETARLKFYPNSPKMTIATTNSNEYAEKFFINQLYKFRYSLLGYLFEKSARFIVKTLRRKKIEEAHFMKSPYIAPNDNYVPAGLLRASMSSQMKSKFTLPSSENMSLDQIFGEMIN